MKNLKLGAVALLMISSLAACKGKSTKVVDTIKTDSTKVVDTVKVDSLKSDTSK